MLQSILMLIRQINRGEAKVENEFTRAVRPEGNMKAIRMMEEVFALRDSFEWRGLGSVPKSALKLSDAYSDFDAEKHFNLVYRSVPDNKACECGAILRGEKQPSTVVHRNGVHTGKPYRLLHGIQRRRLRRLLHLRQTQEIRIPENK